MQLAGIDQYVEAALRLLKFVEARSPTDRRFGANADARWSSFKGDLETIDRIELMIRDADAEWPAGFGARVVYGLDGIAEDEPFGARWPSMDPVDAEELWRRVKDAKAPKTVEDALSAIARSWKLKLEPVKVKAIDANEQLLVVGPSAIASLIEKFASDADLSWADQVTVVATPPAHRQLAAAATALLNLSKPGRIVNASEAAKVKARDPRLVKSDDADDADLAAAKELVG